MTGRRTTDLPRRRWPAVLALVLVLVVIGSAGYVVWFSSVLGLRTVTVAGVDDVLTADIRGAIDQVAPPGTPLVRIDVADVRTRLDAIPQVAAVTVTRTWPDGLVVIATPRTPVALTSANGRLWLLDSTGSAYQRVDRAPAGLATVELVAPGAGDPATMAALQVVGSMTADFRSRVAAVRASSPYDIRVRLKDGRTVIWGGVEDGGRKMRALQALLGQPGTIFDISDPTMATVR